LIDQMQVSPGAGVIGEWAQAIGTANVLVEVEDLVPFSFDGTAQADALLERKVGHVRATGASMEATANPGCHLQIERGVRDDPGPIRVLHPISLLAAAYRRELPGGAS
jgi:Fe-S oxidoreductase